MKHNPEIKAEAISRHFDKKESVDAIVNDIGIPRSTLYNWVKQHREQAQQKSSTPALTQRLHRTLENRIRRLEGIIEILKTIPCTVHAPLQERLNEIEKLQGQYSVHMLCDAMDIARGTFYNHILRNKRDKAWFVRRKEELRLKIQEIYDGSNQILGAKKITAVMKNQGIRVSSEMVSRLMQDMGLVSIRQGSKKLYDKEASRGKNHLNQQFDVQKPNQVWCSDITLFNHKQKNYYICVIIDLFARKVVGYMVSHRNSIHLVKMTFQKAYKERQPQAGLIFHTDRGSNYRSSAVREYLMKLGVSQSFSRPYTPYDNSVLESFFSSMKREELYRTKYKSERELREAIDAYIHFYNEKRPHSKTKYKTPNQVEADYAERTAHLVE